MTQHEVRTAVAVAVALGLVAAAGVLAWQTTLGEGGGQGGTAAAPVVADLRAQGGTTGTTEAARQGPAGTGTACATTAERVYDLVAVPPLDCATAEAVALAYDRAVMAAGAQDGTVTAAGHTCAVVSLSPPETESSEVVCTGPAGRTGFTWGV